MNSVLTRVLSLLLAFAAIGGVLFMADSRTDRSWSLEPTWPYVQPAHAHWFYRTLQALPTENMRLGIWGWAAHAWVYTGTIPATTETSTEFAWLDWGSNGYYRKRFLEALKKSQPEYFMIAVGPGHFLFNDRTTHGVQTLPELDEFLKFHYTTVLDDGETGLLIRNDFYENCCQPKQLVIMSGGVSVEGDVPTESRHKDSQAWARAQTSDGAAIAEAAWTVSVDQKVNAIIVPFRFSQVADRSMLQIGVRDKSGALSGCEAALAAAPAETTSMCVLDHPSGISWTISARITGATPNDWIEIGRPFLASSGETP